MNPSPTPFVSNSTALVEVMNRHEAQLQAQALRARQQRTRATLIFVAFVLATAITLAFLSIDRYHKAVRLRLQKQLSKAQLEIFRQKEQIESMINPNPEDTARLPVCPNCAVSAVSIVARRSYSPPGPAVCANWRRVARNSRSTTTTNSVPCWPTASPTPWST